MSPLEGSLQSPQGEVKNDEDLHNDKNTETDENREGDKSFKNDWRSQVNSFKNDFRHLHHSALHQIDKAAFTTDLGEVRPEWMLKQQQTSYVL